MKAFVASLALAGAANAGLVLPHAGLPLAGHLGYAAPYAAQYAAPYYAPGAVTYAAPGPITYAAAAAPAIVPHPTPSSQFQTQDEFGNLAYGYENINSRKIESGNTYGGVQGSYSYVDANGLVQTTNYVADALGFRVQATNLPVGPVADLKQPVHTLEQVKDTEEVAAAKAEFQKAFDEASSRHKRSVVLPASTLPLSYGLAPYSAYSYAPYAFNGYAAPYNFGYTATAPYAAATYAAPYAAPAAVAAVAPAAAHEATLTTIKNNPGFATSYMVQ